MGLPKILIEFKTLAETMIARSERGIVALILTDNSNSALSYSFSSESEVVKSHFTTLNNSYIHLAFLGSPAKVLVERVTTGSTLSDALARLTNKKWSYLAVPVLEEGDASTVSTYIREMRTAYKSFKAVLPDTTANHEGIINFATDNIKVGAKTYTSEEYCARIAGILAGLPLNRSATYYVLEEAKSIDESQTPDADIDNGKLILINEF